MALVTVDITGMSLLILGFNNDIKPFPSEEQIMAAYKKAAMILHPDVSKSHEMLLACSMAKEHLLKVMPRPVFTPPAPSYSYTPPPPPRPKQKQSFSEDIPW